MTKLTKQIYSVSNLPTQIIEGTVVEGLDQNLTYVFRRRIEAEELNAEGFVKDFYTLFDLEDNLIVFVDDEAAKAAIRRLSPLCDIAQSTFTISRRNRKEDGKTSVAQVWFLQIPTSQMRNPPDTFALNDLANYLS